MSKKINNTEVNFSFKEKFCRKVVTGQIRLRLHDWCPIIRVARNLPAGSYSIEKQAGVNDNLNPTEGHYFNFWYDSFVVKIHPLSLLVHSFAKLIQFLKLASHTLLTMHSRTESKDFSHPNEEGGERCEGKLTKDIEKCKT